MRSMSELAKTRTADSMKVANIRFGQKPAGFRPAD
jgi:hypothetical protein